MRSYQVSSSSDREPSNAFIGLRRSLWQLAIVAAGAAMISVWMSPAPGVLPAWLLLLPISALLVHYRDAISCLLRARVDAASNDAERRRRAPRRQAQRSETISRRRAVRTAPATRVKR
ncbi:MAG: hypothetical protein ABIQ97_06490 [Lysobacteraceae bacterium]